MLVDVTLLNSTCQDKAVDIFRKQCRHENINNTLMKSDCKVIRVMLVARKVAAQNKLCQRDANISIRHADGKPDVRPFSHLLSTFDDHTQEERREYKHQKK